MRARKLGPGVRSLAESIPFYRDVLGLTEVARYGTKMAFSWCGDKHHELALLEVGAQAAPARGTPSDARPVGGLGAAPPIDNQV